MDRILSAAPHPELRTFVRAYAQRQVHGAGAEAQPVSASLEQVLQFEFGDPLTIEYRNGIINSTGRLSIVGAHSYSRASIRFCGKIESFAVFFQPFALWQLFHLPNQELNNQAYDASDILGNNILNVWSRMAEASLFAQRVAIINAFLLRRVAGAIPQTLIMAAAMHLFRNQGMERIATVADNTGLSVRHFERRFLTEAGMTPKLFARISRFQGSLDAKLRKPHQPWMTVAHEFGYHDQMHMLRDFRELGGMSPGHLLAQLGGGRPTALAASEP